MAQFAYASGFASLEHESEPCTLEVRGTPPGWLQGSLLRTGPAKFEVGSRTYNHWFDGLAMLHRFAFTEGRVGYASRFLKSRAFTEAERTGQISYAEFATDPCRTLFGRIAAVFDPKLTDNCCVNVSDYGGETVAFTESAIPVRFASATLETLGVFEYAPQLRGQMSIAHPHFDAARGCHYSYIVDFGLHSRYRLFRVTTAGVQEQVAEIEVDHPAYMHSFAMTERHLVLTEFPLVVSPLDLKFSGQPFIRNYRWRPERGLRVHVVEKDSGALVASKEAEALFAFHHVNAFEEDGALLIDMSAYPDPGIIDQLYLARLRAGLPIEARPMLTRLAVPLGEGPVTRTTLAEATIELARINYEQRAGKPYRYVWGTGIAGDGDFFDSIVKIDIATGSAGRWAEAGCYPGEPVFVAAPGATAEDDGALLSVVLDAAKRSSFLLVLDAATLEEKARAAAPRMIPFHFHGNYFAEAGAGAGRA